MSNFIDDINNELNQDDTWKKRKNQALVYGSDGVGRVVNTNTQMTTNTSNNTNTNNKINLPSIQRTNTDIKYQANQNSLNKTFQMNNPTVDTTRKNTSDDNSISKFLSNIFKSSDSLKKGDILTTATNTLGDIGANVTQGFLNTAEGVGDALQYGVSGLLGMFGSTFNNQMLKDASEAVKKNAQYNSTGAWMGTNDDAINKGWMTELDKNSVLGTSSDSISQGVGNMMAMMGLSYIDSGTLGLNVADPLASTTGVAGKYAATANAAVEAGAMTTTQASAYVAAKVGFLTTGINSFGTAFGNKLSEEYNNGADDKTAFTNATISGLAEGISEEFFDGIPGAKSAGWGEKKKKQIASKLTEYFDKNSGKAIDTLLEMNGEGLEEVISNLIETTGTDLVYSVNKNYNKGDLSGNLVTDLINTTFSKESVDAYLSAAISTGIMQGGNVIVQDAQKSNLVNKLVKEQGLTEEQAKQAVDKMYNTESNTSTNQDTQENTQEDNTTTLDINTNQEVSEQQQILNNIEELKSEQSTTTNQKQLDKIDNNIQKLQEQFNSLQEQEDSTSNSASLSMQQNEQIAPIVNEQQQIAPIVNNTNNTNYDYLTANENNSKFLTEQEKQELNTINKQLDGEIEPETSEDPNIKKAVERATELQEKATGTISETKYPSLKANPSSYDDIKDIYKYTHDKDFNSKIADEVAKNVPGYQNSNRRTKEQWLEIAKNIGASLNVKNDADLSKYAMQSWAYFTLNQKENLNRQGVKYNKFTADEWVNAVYQGAGVGQTTTRQIAPVLQPTQIKTSTKQIAPVQTNTQAQQESVAEATKSSKNSKIKAPVNETLESTAKAAKIDTTAKGKAYINTLQAVQEARTEISGSKFTILIDPNVSGNGVWYEDSKTGNRYVRLNPNSKNSIEYVLLHEITHDLEGTPEYSKLKSTVEEFNNGKLGYKEAKDNLTNIYKEFAKNNPDKLDAKILTSKYMSYETTADTSAMLLGDKNFIESLSKERTVMQKITDKLDEVYNIIKSYAKGDPEAAKNVKFLYQLREQYRQAFNTTYNNNSNAKYSAKSSIEINDNIDVDKLTPSEAGDIVSTILKDNNLDTKYSDLKQKIINKFLLDDTFASKIKETSKELQQQADIRKAAEQASKIKKYDTKVSNIQGLENYDRGDVEQYVYDYIENEISGIKGVNYSDAADSIYIQGSRNRGTARQNSYLDVAFFYDGKAKEDNLFNALNGKDFNLDGINIDINPINTNNISKEDYINKSKEYDNNVLSKNSKNLLAIQNISEDKLKKSLELGGFASPSIAITNPDIVNHSEFGNISLVYSKDTINPENKQNEVYDRDVWSPTFPTVEYKLNDKELNKISNTINKFKNVYSSSANNYFVNNLEDIINQNGIDNTIEQAKKNYGMKYVYLTNNTDFQPVMKNKNFSYDYSNDILQEFINNYKGNKPLNELSYDEEMSLGKQIKDIVKPIEQEKIDNKNYLSNVSEEVMNNIKSIEQHNLDNLDKNYSKIDQFIKSAYQLQKLGNNYKEIDQEATNNLIDNVLDKNKYNKWIDNLFSNVIEKKGIVNNKELFTPSGNRRTFNQTHYDYNLDNIVKMMTEGRTQGGEQGIFSNGFGSIQAQMANKFNTIDEIKNNQNQITNNNNSLLEPIKMKLLDDIDNISNKYIGSSFTGYDNAEEAILELEKGKISKDRFYSILKDYGFDLNQINDSDIKNIIDDLNSLKKIPTDYFEAKPQRAVTFDEIKAVVVPTNIDNNLLKALKDKGLNIVTYNENIDGDRQNKIKQLNDYKFSINSNNGKWQQYLNNIKQEVAPNNETTKFSDLIAPTKSQIAPVKYSIAANTQNDFVTIKQEAKEIAKTLNNNNNIAPSKNGNQRSWVDTSLESKVLKGKITINDLDTNRVNYQPISNAKTLNRANTKLNNMGYNQSIDYVRSKMFDGKISVDDVALAERLIQEASKKGDAATASELIMDTATLGTELGQKVQALSIIQRLTPEGQLAYYQKIVQRAKAKGDTSFQNVEITNDMAENILGAYNKDGSYDQNDLNKRVEEFKQDVADQMTSTNSEKILSWRYLSMLGNPKTHIRNVVANVAMKGAAEVKNAMARTIESVAPISQEQRTKTWKRTSQEVNNYVDNIVDEMQPQISGESKYSTGSQLNEMKSKFSNKFLDSIDKFNSDMLEKEDWIFSKSAFKSTLKEYLTSQGIETQEDIDNNPEIVQKGKNYAVEQSQIQTFRQYSWLASQLNRIESKNKLTQIAMGAVIPFKKTPINIAKTGINYSPLGLIKTMSYDLVQVKNGNMEASQFIDNLSQGMTGTGLALLGYALAKGGVINGSGDDDKKDKYDTALGKQDYSLNIGGNTYSLSWLSPVAMPLLMGANAYEQLENKNGWNMNIITDTLAKTLDPISDMSFLSSLDDVLSSYSSGTQKVAAIAENAAQNYIMQFFPTMFAQIASLTDDYKRSTTASRNSQWKFGEETMKQIMYKIPGLREQLDPTTNIWGEPNKQSDNLVQRALEIFITPYTRKTYNETTLDKEIKRVYSQTGKTQVIPGTPYSYLSYNNVKYEMSSSEYTKYKETYGQTANKYLNNLITTSAYKQATDDQKASMIQKVYDYSKASANSEYFTSQKVDYTSSDLTKLNKIKTSTNNDKEASNYIAVDGLASSIKNDTSLDTETRKVNVGKAITSSSLNNNTKYSLYSGYYSDGNSQIAEKLGINADEYIDYATQTFSSDKTEDGKTISNSKKTKVINYVNGLDLSIPEKAILIKMEYSSFKTYDNQIINYINNQDLTKQEKTDILTGLGFTVKNGVVYK